MAVLAARLPYVEFHQRMTNWERTEDENGAGDRAARAHRNRNARMDCGLDGAWDLLGKFGSLQGLEINEIFSHFVEAERLTDWAEARARLGDAVTAEDLCRTEPQRRADGFHAAMRAAASAFANAPGGSIIVANIVMDLTTFERQLCRVAGIDPGPDDRAAIDLADEAATLQPLDLDRHPNNTRRPADPARMDPTGPDPDGDDCRPEPTPIPSRMMPDPGPDPVSIPLREPARSSILGLRCPTRSRRLGPGSPAGPSTATPSTRPKPPPTPCSATYDGS